MPPFFRSLYFRVLVAIALGVLVGAVWPAAGARLGVLGEGFVKLVKMTIAPLVFCTLVVGIAGMSGVKSVGRAGGLALLYFELMSSLALVIGLVVINVVQPGAGMNLHPGAAEAAAVAKYAEPSEPHTVTKFVMDIIPDTLVGAFTKGELLPVLLVAFLVAFALQRMGERGKPVLDLIDRFGHAVFEIVGMIMQLAPIGAFGAMAYTVGAFGAAELVPLAMLMACFYATCLVFVFGVLGGVAHFAAGFSIFRFVRYIASELALVLGTSSSESALPRLMAKLEKLGASKSVVGLVVPAGYSFNLDGTSIYLTMAAVFVAQATNTPLDIPHQLVLLAVLLLTSKGAAGVSGSGFIVLAATLHTVGDVPVAGLAVILGIDRFMSEGRALTNIVGNGVATLVVARTVGELDREQLAAELAAGPG